MSAGVRDLGDPPPHSAQAPRRDTVLAEVLDALSDGLAVFDADGALVLHNRHYKSLNPLIADLIVPGVGWAMLIRESVQRGAIIEEEASRLRWMESRLAEPDQPPPLEVRSPTGAVHEIALRPTSTGGFILVQRDMTERKQYEIGDQQAELLLQKVLEACPANVVMSRIGDGQIIYRSPAATELLGTSRCYYDHFASREQRADFITALLPDGRVDDIQVTGLRADGAEFPCTVSARIIEYKGEDVMVSNTVDISKEVALKKTLDEQREQIFQAEKMSALGELLAGVAHELNNPLSVVVGHALMMREETSEQTTLRRLEKISGAAERCARIVKSFLAMARQQPARLAPVDLRETLETAIDALQQGATGLKSAVEVDLPRDLPNLLADADQIAQVFINLLTNADQAIDSTKIGGRISISARFDPAAAMVEIRVADDGPGIPKEVQSRIFDPLFTTKDVGKGTGIGLAFCHRVVTSHNGQIKLDQANGRGATFILRLPTTGRSEHLQSSASLPPRRPAATNVLVVDDESDVADLIRDILQADGFEVEHALSTEAALAKLAGGRYGLILTDLNMPGMGGRGFYAQVVRDFPELAERLGFVTGDTMSPSARRFLESAKRPYLEKPLAPSDLRRLARQLAGSAGAKGR
jgi:signal transduction histidine kinase